MGNLTFRVPLIEYKRISDRPGNRDDPMNPGTTEHHNGIDFAVPIGRDVLASERGLVIRASKHGDFDNLIIIDHTPLAKENDRHIYSLYAHLSTMDVELGDFVSKDHEIALSGNSGPDDTDFHLHFGIYESKDPEKDLEWKAEGDHTGVDPSNSSNPADYLFRTLSVEGTIIDADDLQDQVRDRIQEVMELVPTVKPENRFWRLDIMVYGKYMGYLDTRTQELALRFSIFEAIELLHRPITKRKTKYVINAK